MCFVHLQTLPAASSVQNESPQPALLDLDPSARTSPASADPAPIHAPPGRDSCGHEILDVSDEALLSWAGKTHYNRARRELATGIAVQCTDGPVFRARIVDWNVESRWLPGAGPAGMLCSCHAPAPCIHRVLAIMAWQIQSGGRVNEQTQEQLAESDEAPRTRDAVRLAVLDSCLDIAEYGFSRLSRFQSARMRTLAVASHGVDLPRLEKLIRSLADGIDHWLARDAHASDDSLLSALSHTHALATALQRPTSLLIGQHRARYERVQTIEIVGAGLACWQSASGYRGLTVYFRDLSSDSWCTWGDARPAEQPFDPATRALAQGPWTGCDSPVAAATMRALLSEAWRSRARRISGRSSSRYTMRHPTTIADLPPPTTLWKDLAAQLKQSMKIGLSVPDEYGSFALIRPVRWGGSTFVEIDQELLRPVIDAEGFQMNLVVHHTSEQGDLLRTIETLAPAAGDCLLVKLTMHKTGLAAQPISLINETGVKTIAMSYPSRRRQSRSTAAASAPPSPETNDSEVDEEDPLSLPRSPLMSRLDACFEHLTAACAVGVNAFRRWPVLEAFGREFRDSGLVSLATALASISAATDARQKARALLSATWILAMSRSQLVLDLGARVQVAASEDEHTEPQPESH
jgi:hypothetical protein